jgi:hypothetical protein
MKLTGWLLGKGLLATFWVLKLPLLVLWSSIKTILALLGEETRRWLALALWGLLLVGSVRAAGAWLRPLLPLLLLALLIWLWACSRAVHATINNRLAAVRARQFYKRLDEATSGMGDKIQEALTSLREENDMLGFMRRGRVDPHSLEAHPEWGATGPPLARDPVFARPPIPAPPRWMRKMGGDFGQGFSKGKRKPKPSTRKRGRS